MAKQQSFAEKAAKSTKERGVKCPKCHTTKVPILYVASERSIHGSIKFNQRREQVCKCNEKSIYG
jgi:hypothetical protein